MHIHVQHAYSWGLEGNHRNSGFFVFFVFFFPLNNRNNRVFLVFPSLFFFFILLLMNLNYFVGQKEGFWTGCGGTLRRARQADHCEFQAILVARVSSRIASGQDYTEKGTLSRKRQKAGFCAGVCMCLQVCFMIYFICNGVKVWGRTWMQVPIKSRRGSQISWNWVLGTEQGSADWCLPFPEKQTPSFCF